MGPQDSHVVFGQKFPGGKRKCVTVRYHDVTVSSFVVKLSAKSSHIFQQSP
jgi:hypothetical protein